GGQPRLATSRSIVSFLPPGAAAPRDVEVQPAQASFGDEATLVGVNLVGGTVEVLVRHASWSASHVADASCGVSSVGGGGVGFTVGPSLAGVALLPGACTAAVRVSRVVTLPDGSTRTLANSSNTTPFLVTPAVTAVAAPDAAGVFQLTGATFQHAELAPE